MRHLFSGVRVNLIRMTTSSKHTDTHAHLSVCFLCFVEAVFSSVVFKVLLVVSVSGTVWSSYRKSCVNTVMKWLVPESSSRYINRMTNEALHKGELCTQLYTQCSVSSKYFFLVTITSYFNLE